MEGEQRVTWWSVVVCMLTQGRRREGKEGGTEGERRGGGLVNQLLSVRNSLRGVVTQRGGDSVVTACHAYSAGRLTTCSLFTQHKL